MAQALNNAQILKKTKEILNFVDSNSRTRGEQLYLRGHVTDWNALYGNNTVSFSVLSANRDKTYAVVLDFDNLLISDCDCPFSWGLCKHIAAAAYKLNTRIQTHNEPIFSIDQKATHVNIPSLTKKWIKENTPKQLKEEVSILEKNADFEIAKMDKGEIHVKIYTGGNTLPVKFQTEKNSTIVFTNCKCKENRYPLCKHKIAALRHLNKKKKENAFEKSLNWNNEKKQLLREFDISFKDLDKYKDIFQFYFENREIYLSVKEGPLLTKGHLNMLPAAEVVPDKPEPPVSDTMQEYSLAYVINFRLNENSPVPFMDIFAATGKTTKDGTRIKSNFKILHSPIYDHAFQELADAGDYKIMQEAGKLEKIMYQYFYDNPKDNLSNYSNIQKTLNVLNPVLKLLSSRIVYLHHDTIHDIKLRDCQQIHVSEDTVKASMKQVSGKHLQEFHVSYLLGDKPFNLNAEETLYFWLLIKGDTVYPWQNAGVLYLQAISNPEDYSRIKFLYEQYNEVFKKFVAFFQDKVEMELAAAYEEQSQVYEPDKKIYIKEESGYIMFFPVIAYGSKEINALNQSEGFLFEQKNKKIYKIQRNPESEADFLATFKQTHEAFQQQRYDSYFYLSPQQMLENNWFISFYEQCKENEIEVYGFKDLKSIKYYPARPNVSYSIKSEENWFDVEMAVDYDKHPVSLKDLRKAVINKEKMVPIGEGMYGMLPDEFVKKFETALKFGEIDKEKVTLQKSQFSIIHSLLDQQSDGEIARELSEKMQLLKSFDEIKPIDPPAQLKATLRDYQKAGLSWLAFLAKYNFGGCLADDMGLGKTVQMLAFFLHLKEKQPRKKFTHLVVCPTTLLFNWENEIAKFTPHLKTEVHWGNNRLFDAKAWRNKDIILTTYGTLVNDIEKLSEFSFTTVVFDESQAMKNPSSLRFKAALLIKADYRFSLTGTPIENNTIELFSQMHVLNKGLLGNLNFFRKTYAKNMEGEENKHLRAELRRIVYPFILRRTKENVASELPEKSEMEFFCEMDEHQRNVYDAFRVKYKDRLLSKIEEEGMNKARFNVLDGILKLRQICDSPSLINTDEYYGDESIKAEELLRQIHEKTTHHKVLVFSQFVKMLELIRARLDEEEILYTTLDGSTRDRQERVNYFQNSDECRVFLISLKAGGSGLNLTAADYVYLVDPWWNPAVETQAIDRTHRIGQQKKVFAYRMICKNTIEEKILNLQKRKKNLADEIITEESSFVKNLTKKDIEHLFS